MAFILMNAIYVENKMCSDCYLISSGWVESNFTKKPIPIIYLPLWNKNDECVGCSRKLKYTSDCQKWCSSCLIIYTGCRFCLTTNIIFGITDQSQCRKCKGVLFITIDTTNIDVTKDESFASIRS